MHHHHFEYQQQLLLEPNSPVFGLAKPFIPPPAWAPVVAVQQPLPPRLSEQELQDIEDGYLAQFGII